MNSILTKQKIVVGDVETMLKKEEYSTVYRMARDLQTRKVTDERFDDKAKEYSDERSEWNGNLTFSEALDTLEKGYEPTTKKLKEVMKLSLKKMTASEKRIRFEESVEGFQPIVPLAIMNIPTSMLDVKIKNIKAKVINIFYDASFIADKSSEDIIKLGQNVFETIIRLEHCGYRFNLYVVNNFCDIYDNDIDMLVVKIKSSNQVVDIRKMSFPLTHTSFSRLLGFSWLEKTPNGVYKGSGYGKTLDVYYKRLFNDDKERKEFLEKVLGKNAIYISGNDILDHTRNEEERRKEIAKYLKGIVNGVDLKKVSEETPKPKKPKKDNPFVITPRHIKEMEEMLRGQPAPSTFTTSSTSAEPDYFTTTTTSGSESFEFTVEDSDPFLEGLQEGFGEFFK